MVRERTDAETRAALSDPRNLTALRELSSVLRRGWYEVRTSFRCGSAAFRRSPQEARRQLRSELCGLFFDRGLALLRGELPFPILPLVGFDGDRLEATVEALAVALGERLEDVLPERWSGPLRRRALREEGAPPLEQARILLDACEFLLPGRDGVGFHRLLLSDLEAGRGSVFHWQSFLDQVIDLSVRQAALMQYAHAARRSDLPTEAMRAAEASLRLAPRSPFATYYAGLYAALAGRADRFRLHLQSWRALFAEDPGSLDRAIQLVRYEASSWHDLSRRGLELPDDLTGALGVASGPDAATVVTTTGGGPGELPIHPSGAGRLAVGIPEQQLSRSWLAPRPVHP